MKATQRLWLTDNGRLVPEGDPKATSLAYVVGDEMSENHAQQLKQMESGGGFDNQAGQQSQADGGGEAQAERADQADDGDDADGEGQAEQPGKDAMRSAQKSRKPDANK